MIKLKNIVKTFEIKGKLVTALDNITINVPKGSIYGIIGESGAGKSTLVRCVNLLERPTSGEVIVNGQELMTLSNATLNRARQQMSMIFQHFNLLSLRTVHDNVALPLELNGTPRAKIKTRVAELLELVGLADRANYYPKNLSGGQKQRVAIARALATSPKILLCDEATSALDPTTTKSILELLKEINEKLNITILLITHEMNVVKQICNHVAILNHGKLVEQGTVVDIFANPKTQIAINFIRSSMDIHLPKEYVDHLSETSTGSDACIIKFNFTGADVDRPLISETTKIFNIKFSILSSQIDYIAGVKFGFVIGKIIGDQENIQKTIEYITNNSVKVEVLGYV